MNLGSTAELTAGLSGSLGSALGTATNLGSTLPLGQVTSLVGPIVEAGTGLTGQVGPIVSKLLSSLSGVTNLSELSGILGTATSALGSVTGIASHATGILQPVLGLVGGITHILDVGKVLGSVTGILGSGLMSALPVNPLALTQMAQGIVSSAAGGKLDATAAAAAILSKIDFAQLGVASNAVAPVSAAISTLTSSLMASGITADAAQTAVNTAIAAVKSATGDEKVAEEIVNAAASTLIGAAGNLDVVSGFGDIMAKVMKTVNVDPGLVGEITKAVRGLTSVADVGAITGAINPRVLSTTRASTSTELPPPLVTVLLSGIMSGSGPVNRNEHREHRDGRPRRRRSSRKRLADCQLRCHRPHRRPLGHHVGPRRSPQLPHGSRGRHHQPLEASLAPLEALPASSAT
ncbi:hypothetical protein L596_015640 [Steinernema carpocapsae]|nr:hypothetical protein L596_015640 [Steinernema carpocapsae]